ncbi:TonB-dependent receptor [Pseudoxanthomonas sangjuensis]|uniref:TonB-dependent receptor n=1 Tax=Pseudoxanthomonas sangjuensis TaxID=1503750 RepID=UPI001390AB18|nr:TonB-dependent receptor [Pseudoxanthomonas sangjuensis]KAF1714147.1 TonB-dependent receptor [Pseudoxanthomonas sangjuensis]
MSRCNSTRHALSVAIVSLLPALAQAQEQTQTQEQMQTQEQTQAPPQSTGAATAQQAPAQAQPPRQSATTLDTVVVTGSVTGGVKKLEASYNIVTATEEQIKQANPKSTADLLKISPGMWPESSGGQTGANIEIAGFPGGGDAPYFTTMLMGSPLYGMPTLSFFETTSIFRLDDTISTVEILQGGPSAVFAGGQMGATANFFLKTGSDTPYGSVGVTYGDEGLWRLDAFSGFPLGQSGWYGSIGGFWRSSDGVRDPQFKADEGGQITGTLSRDFGEGGNLTLYARYLDDKNQFITPIPVVQEGSDEFHAYPGFDPLTDTYYSEAMRKVFLPTYPGGKDADLADGRGAKFFFFGGNFDYDFDNGWSISDKFLFDEGDADTNALFSGNNPAPLMDMLYDPDTPGGFSLPAGSATATYVGGGAVPLDQSVIQQGWWSIHKHLKSLSNDFRLSKELFEGNTLTIGLYVNRYTMDDKWSLGNQMLMSNTPNATPITVSYVDPADGLTKQRTDGQGFADFGGFHIAQHGDATNTALYLSDSWRVGQWLLDLSGRLERQDATNNVCNLANQDLDGDPNTLYDNNTPVCDGTFARIHYEKTHPTWTAGANYAFTDRMSAYVRVNTGGHFLDFDNGIRGTTNNNFPPMQKVRNYEGGFKYQSDLLYADISAYQRRFKGLLYQPTDGLGTPVGSPLTYGSDSWGVNFIGWINPTENLRLQLVANYLDGKYSDFDACFPYVDINGQDQCQPIEGQQLQRQPKLRFMFTPSYDFVFGWGDVTPYLTYTHVGDHTQDQSGLQQLGSYHTLDFGVTANVGYHWQFNLRGTNMTDELGLTESNSRIFGTAVSGAENVLLARPLEGREVNLQAKYLW